MSSNNFRFGKLIKKLLIIIPAAFIGLFILEVVVISLMSSSFDVKNAKGAGNEKTLNAYFDNMIPEENREIIIVYNDLIIPEDVESALSLSIKNVNDEAVKNADIKKCSNYFQDIGAGKVKLRATGDKIIEKLCAIRSDIKFVDRNRIAEIQKEMKFQNSDWSNENKTAEMGKALNASAILTITVSECPYKLSPYSTYIDYNPLFTMKLLNINTMVSQTITLKSYDISNIYTDNFSDKINFSDFYVNQEKSDPLLDSGEWIATGVGVSNITYPSKQGFLPCPFGKAPLTMLKPSDKKAQEYLMGLETVTFDWDVPSLAFEDGKAKEGKYSMELTEQNEVSVAVKKDLWEKYKNNYRADKEVKYEKGKDIQKSNLYFTDGQIGLMTLRSGNTFIFRNAPVYKKDNNTFYVLAGYDNGNSGKAYFVEFSR